MLTVAPRGEFSGLPWIVERLGRQLVLEVPRHPVLWVERRLVGITLQLGDVIVSIHVGYLASINKTHEQVANGGTVQGLIEEGVFSVEDGLF